MVRRLALTPALLSVGLAACALPQVVPEALSTDFNATGSVAVRGRTATFDEVRVRSPKMNLTKRVDGSWGGLFAERPIDVSVDGQSLRGAEFTLSRKDSTEGRVVITGQFQGRIYRFELDDQRALIRTPSLSVTYEGRMVQTSGVSYGTRGELVLLGEAGQELPPWPQFALALMAAFN